MLPALATAARRLVRILRLYTVCRHKTELVARMLPLFRVQKSTVEFMEQVADEEWARLRSPIPSTSLEELAVAHVLVIEAHAALAAAEVLAEKHYTTANELWKQVKLVQGVWLLEPVDYTTKHHLLYDACTDLLPA